MIIVITPEVIYDQEVYWVNQLFKSGIDLLHIRKYGLQDSQLIDYVNSIDAIYRDKLVLHSHNHLSSLLNINRLHIREVDRTKGIHGQFIKNKTLSTSVHNINDFNNLEPFWNYALLSPMFPSISKPGYGTSTTILSQLGDRTNIEVKLIGLGGIKMENVNEVRKENLDGVALLGAIWNNPIPSHYFNLFKN